jgi:hypothetical protein
MRTLKVPLFLLANLVSVVALWRYAFYSGAPATLFTGLDENAVSNDQKPHFLDESTERLMWFVQVNDSLSNPLPFGNL